MKATAVKSKAAPPPKFKIPVKIEKDDTDEEEIPQWNGRPEDFDEFTERARMNVLKQQATAREMEEETPTLDSAQVL